MKKEVEDNEDVTEENVEKYMIKALKKYREIHQDTDFWFWRLSLPLFRKKVEKDKISEVRDDVAELLVKEAKDTVWLNPYSTFWEGFEDMLEKKYGLKPVGWTKYSRKYFDKKFRKVKPRCMRTG